MKKLLTLIVFGIFPIFLFGQIPEAFNYQAVARNSSGEILYDEIANFKIELLQNGTSIYSEEHTGNSGETGVVNFKVGQGTNPLPPMGFSQIDWSQGQLQIKVTLNGEPMGTADIVSVPFSLYAQNAGSSYWIKENDDIYYNDGIVGIGIIPPINASSQLMVNAENFGSPFSVGNILNLSSDGSEGSLVFGKLNAGGDGYIQSAKNGGASKLVLNPEGGGSGSVQIFGSVFGSPFTSGNILELNTQGAQGSLVFGKLNGGGDSYVQSAKNGGASKLVLNPEGGIVSVPVLEITGGGDGAEYFNVEESNTLKPGCLVIIDEDNEGKLKISSKPYDTRIAGVISGAGGVKPGITLEQKEVLEGDELVSLWGRVYVKATTENGKIKPGDLLTSSSLEGHVMKATKRNKSQGAIIGKALSRLDEGEELILILIQPQ